MATLDTKGLKCNLVCFMWFLVWFARIIFSW